MDQKRVIAAGILALVAAILVLGMVLYFTGLVASSAESDDDSLANLPVVSMTTSPTPSSSLTPGFSGANNVSSNLTPTPTRTAGTTAVGANSTGAVVGNLQTYQGDDFTLMYPKDWGLLTCSNSANFEFDPISNQDQRIACDRALKAVTVLVQPKGSLTCEGEVTQIGSHNIVKSKKVDNDGYTTYRWCFDLGSHSFDITHRTSPNGERATSREDFSSEVEDVISNFRSINAPSPS